MKTAHEVTLILPKELDIFLLCENINRALKTSGYSALFYASEHDDTPMVMNYKDCELSLIGGDKTIVEFIYKTEAPS